MAAIKIFIIPQIASDSFCPPACWDTSLPLLQGSKGHCNGGKQAYFYNWAWKETLGFFFSTMFGVPETSQRSLLCHNCLKWVSKSPGLLMEEGGLSSGLWSQKRLLKDHPVRVLAYVVYVIKLFWKRGKGKISFFSCSSNVLSFHYRKWSQEFRLFFSCCFHQSWKDIECQLA